MKTSGVFIVITLFLLSFTTISVTAQLPDPADLRKKAEVAQKKAEEKKRQADAAKAEAEAKQKQLEAEKRAAAERAEEAARAKLALFQKVLYFQYNSTTVAAESQETLNEILNGLDTIKQKIETAPSGTVLKLTGHADSLGEADYNMKLSTSRAEALKEVISGKGVILDSMISTEGKGETELAEAGEQAKNRRVVLTLGYVK